MTVPFMDMGLALPRLIARPGDSEARVRQDDEAVLPATSVTFRLRRRRRFPRRLQVHVREAAGLGVLPEASRRGK